MCIAVLQFIITTSGNSAYVSPWVNISPFFFVFFTAYEKQIYCFSHINTHQKSTKQKRREIQVMTSLLLCVCRILHFSELHCKSFLDILWLYYYIIYRLYSFDTLQMYDGFLNHLSDRITSISRFSASSFAINIYWIIHETIKVWYVCNVHYIVTKIYKQTSFVSLAQASE